MVSVLLADDQALVRGGFRVILDANPDIDVVGEAADGAEAIRLTAKLKPDVVVMDVRMPVLDGIEATRRILSSNDGPRVLVLTTFDVDEYVFEALRAGASGFLLKTAAPHQLTRAVLDVHRGDILLAPEITRRLIMRFVERRQPDRDAEWIRLTTREQEVLRLIASGLSNTEIAARIFVAETTVRNHVSRILGKLNLRDRAQAVIFAYECGAVRAGDSPDRIVRDA